MKTTYEKDKYILHGVSKCSDKQYIFDYTLGYSDKYGFHYRDSAGNMVRIKNKNRKNIFNSIEEMEKAGISYYTFKDAYHDLREEAYLLELKNDGKDVLTDLDLKEGFVSNRGTIFNVTSVRHDSEGFVVKKIDITNKKWYKVFNDDSEAMKYVEKQYGKDAAHYLYKRICDRLEGILGYYDSMVQN